MARSVPLRGSRRSSPVAQFLDVRPRVAWEIFVAGTFFTLRFSLRQFCDSFAGRPALPIRQARANAALADFLAAFFGGYFLSYERIVA